MAKAHSHAAQFDNAEAFKRFMLAGNAVFTIVSKRSGTRFTYRIRQGQEELKGKKPPHFVSLLNGPDNSTSYEFFGTIFGRDEKTFQMGRRARITESAPSVQALLWVWRHLEDTTLFDKVEIWHKGKCGKCRKALTVPESIASGLGPVCAKGGF